MEIDEAETLELVGVLVYSSIAQIPVSGELSQFQLTLYCPGEDNTPTGPWAVSFPSYRVLGFEQHSLPCMSGKRKEKR